MEIFMFLFDKQLHIKKNLQTTATTTTTTTTTTTNNMIALLCHLFLLMTHKQAHSF
ncbi:hypothetical protein DOY81_010451 [Sarcophaga bullata]|nr:hypothetical protein DOY81_010451 [Sarcophaga bullata]